MLNKYDYLIVGAGLFGSVCAYELNKKGYKVLVIDQREHIGGNCYTYKKHKINIHKYGAHIFHTDKKEVWNYVNNLTEFETFKNEPIAVVNGKTYNLPFNMNTFSKIFNLVYPEDIKKRIQKETEPYKNLEPKNLEEQCLKSVGRTIYNLLIKGYTEKQWGRSCKEIPASVIKRLPLRFTYDNNYFNDKYQGIPKNGYTTMFNTLLKDVKVVLNKKFVKNEFNADKIIYTGMVDEYFDFKLGSLEYRTLHFENKIFDLENYQGNAVFNYPDLKDKHTRTIEHKHFNKSIQTDKTIVSWEFSKEFDYKKGDTPFYPIGTSKNKILYKKYLELAKKEKNVYFCGRLGQYKYFDMDDTIENALLFLSTHN